MKTPRPFHESIETIHTIVPEAETLDVVCRTWVNSEVDAQKIADLEAKQATDDGRKILRTFVELTGRQYQVIIGRWKAMGSSLDAVGEAVLAQCVASTRARIDTDEKEAAKLRERLHALEAKIGSST